MKSFTIGSNDAGQRLDRFVQKVAPALPTSLLQRYIRIKRIKRNKKRAENSDLLIAGDLIELYINDEFFPSEDTRRPPFLTARRELDILYEDENVLLADKRPGLVVHEDNVGERDTLINRIQRLLYERGEYLPEMEQSFAPALCNRIDRNTGGIVIAAKNAETLRVINALIRERKIKKEYLCLIHGQVSPPEGTLRHYLRKDSERNHVTVYDTPREEAKTALTRYRTIETRGAYSLVEIELLTGRTHQIRAQFAHIGHPLLGDAKYGRAYDNQACGYSYQALYAFRLTLEGGAQSAHLAYLNEKTFEVSRVWFAEEFYNGTLR